MKTNTKYEINIECINNLKTKIKNALILINEKFSEKCKI